MKTSAEPDSKRELIALNAALVERQPALVRRGTAGRGSLARRVLARLAVLAATLVASGLLAATLTRLAPGFGFDEESLDYRLSEESRATLRASRQGQGNILTFYGLYLRNAMRGEFGASSTLGAPVRELLGDRIPVTARLAGVGLLAGWTAGLGLALAATLLRSPLLDAAGTLLGGLLLCAPAALISLGFALWAGPASLALGVVLFPKIFRYTRNALQALERAPHVLAARARGLGRGRILFWHIAPVAMPQFLALAGVSVNLALGIAVPVEVLCDKAGIGQLAWKASLGRDLPLLVALTLVVTAITLASNAAADVAVEACGTGRA